MASERQADRSAGGTIVYRTLLDRIRKGEVAQQARLVDTVIASELDVSRMPVREALLRLVHEGYLVGTTRGFMLPQLSARDITEIFEVRKLIEPRAAGAAAQALDEFGLATLRTAHGNAVRAVDAGDPVALMEANTRFRQTWIAAVPNQRLAATISRFVDHVQTIRSATLFDRETQAIVLPGLTELLAGFEARDVLRVHDATARFLDRAEERFFANTQAADAARAAAAVSA